MPDKEEKQLVETKQKQSHSLDMPVHLSGGLMPRNYGELVDFAKMVASSGMVPKNYQGQPGAVLVAFQMGAELGLTPMAAVRSIAVINGRPAVWGDSQLALVRSHQDCEDVIEDDLEVIRKAKKATCVVKRRGRSPVKRTFSYDDAKEAGLWGKAGPWTQYWPRMMQMRARGFALRDAFADVLTGVVSVEEARDYTEYDAGPAEYIDPAVDLPGEGKRSFSRAVQEEKPTANSPAADTPEDDAIEGIVGLPATVKDEVLAKLELVAANDTRQAVVEAAADKIAEILRHREKANRANPGRLGDEMPDGNGMARSGQNTASSDPPAPQEMAPDEEPPHDPVTGEVQQEIGF